MNEWKEVLYYQYEYFINKCCIEPDLPSRKNKELFLEILFSEDNSSIHNRLHLTI